MRLLHEPIRLWARGQHEPVNAEGLRAVRCELGFGQSRTIPMPSTRELRHYSYGFGASVTMVDGSKGFVLVAPVEARFAREALIDTIRASPHHGQIHALSDTGTVQPLATEWHTSHHHERGRLRRLSFYLDRDDLESSIGFLLVRRYAASLVHIHHEYQSFPVVARQLWLVPATRPYPAQFTRRSPPPGP